MMFHYVAVNQISARHTQMTMILLPSSPLRHISRYAEYSFAHFPAVMRDMQKKEKHQH
jgi:hypothetical protein